MKIIIGIPFYKGPFYAPLWFIRDLFVLSAFAPWIKKGLQKWPGIILFGITVIWFLPVNGEFRNTFTFFTLGGLISTNDSLRNCIIRPNGNCNMVCVMVGIIGSLIDNAYIQKLSVLCLTFFVFQVCKHYETNERISNYAERLITYSMVVYVLHGKLLSITQIMYMRQFPGLLSANIGYAILPFFVSLFCIVIGVLLRHLLPRVYETCMGETLNNKIDRSE